MDETNRMYLNNLIGRLTYGKELLNFRKNSNFYKTNHLQLHRANPPAPTARKNNWRTDETNHVCLGVKRAAGNRLTYEKRAAQLQKTSHSYKTNHPGDTMPIRPAPNPALFLELRDTTSYSLMIPKVAAAFQAGDSSENS